MKRLFLLLLLASPCSATGYNYYRTLTISSANVTNVYGTLNNFPVLVSTNVVSISTASAGGHLLNANAYDVVFTTVAPVLSAGSWNCPYLLNWDTETVNNTGSAQANIWVSIPQITTATLTAATFYMCYGNAGISSYQGISTATWDSSYKGVWHLPNGTTLTANDSTSNAVNGTNAGMSAVSAKIDGGASGNGSDGVQINTAVSPYAKSVFSSGLTLEAWVNPAATPTTNARQIISIEGAYFIDVTITNKLGFEINGSGTDIITSASVANTTWTYIVGTSDGSGNLMTYVNGAADTTGSQSFFDIDTLSRTVSFAGHPTVTGYNFNGSIDELHISNTARSADWIKTEYNNQSSPSTFVTIGVEVPSGAPPSTNGIFMGSEM